MHLLVDPGHASEHGGLDERGVATDGVERLRKDDGHTAKQVDVGDHPFERVAERQERQGHVVLMHVERIGARQHDGTGGLIAGGLLFFALGVVLARVGQKKLD